MVYGHSVTAHNLVVAKLKEIQKRQLTRERDPETDHEEADKVLLEYINSQEIKDAYLSIDKWYV